MTDTGEDSRLPSAEARAMGGREEQICGETREAVIRPSEPPPPRHERVYTTAGILDAIDFGKTADQHLR